MADQEFEKKLRDRLAHYEEEPKDDLWGGIWPQLPAAVPFFMKKKGRYLAAAIIVTIIGLLWYGFSLTDKEQKKVELITSSTEAEISSEKPIDSSEKQQVPAGQKGSSTSPKNEFPQQQAYREVDGDEISTGKEINTKPVNDNRHLVDVKNHNEVSNVTSGNTDDGTYHTSHVILEPEIAYLNGIRPGWHYPKPTLRNLTGLEDNLVLAEKKRTEKYEDKENEEKTDSGTRRFTFYAYAMPTFDYNRVEANNSDNIFVSGIEKVTAFSSERIGLRLETGASYEMNPRLSVFSGLVYFQRKQDINYTVSQVKTIEREITEINSTVITPTFEEEEKTYENDLKNIGLQFGVLYRMNFQKFLQTIGTGIEFHKALNKPNAIFDDFEQPDYYVYYNLFYRLEYPRDSRLKGLFQPTLNYSLDLNNKLNAPFYVKPFGFGLNFGLTYRF